MLESMFPPVSLASVTESDPLTDTTDFDVIIIGGSYSGLSAAMALGRSLRNVLIIDSGRPCNRQTPYSHNFITQDGVKPFEIAEKAKAQVLQYPTVKYMEGLAVEGEKTENGFVIVTEKGQEYKAKKLIIATGIEDLLPDIKGFSECWGISVIHCPYCHGYEFRGQKTGIIANREKAFHLASLVHNLTKDLTILTSGKAEFTSGQLEKLNKNRIHVIETPIIEIEHEKGNIRNVLFHGRDQISFDAVYAAVPFRQHSDIPVSLGCELTEQGHIKVDNFQKTTVEGVYACGDNSSMMRSVASAVYSGSITGAMINMELAQHHF